MSAAGAICEIATATGSREVAVEDFVVGVGRNALAPGEFLLGLKLAMPSSGTKDAYLRFTPRTEMDIAVAGVGVSLTVAGGQCTDARVAIGAVAPTALLVPEAAQALVGTDSTTLRCVRQVRHARPLHLQSVTKEAQLNTAKKWLRYCVAAPWLWRTNEFKERKGGETTS